MVEKIELWQSSDLPTKEFMVRKKINELCDAINELQEWVDTADKLLSTLVEENNIHERQIDKLQQKVLHEYKSIYDVIADADLSDKRGTK